MALHTKSKVCIALDFINDVIMNRGIPLYPHTVLSPTEFAIGDTSSATYQSYQHGGIARQVKVTKTLTFQSLEKQLPSPEYITADFAKMEAPLQIHTALLALDRYMAEAKTAPRTR